MSRIFLISDLHLSHNNMAIKRGFNSAEEHDNHIIEQWNKVVHKKDTVWILGDLSMGKSSPYVLLDKLNGIKNVVLGNHDMPQHIPELLKHVNKVCGMFKYKQYFFTHCPIHPTELNYRVIGNIHGHLHENNILISKVENKEKDFLFEIKDTRYINVSCEQPHINFTPQLFTNLIKQNE
jgi:calcineurin-like phosphoesterase family protein